MRLVSFFFPHIHTHAPLRPRARLSSLRSQKEDTHSLGSSSDLGTLEKKAEKHTLIPWCPLLDPAGINIKPRSLPLSHTTSQALTSALEESIFHTKIITCVSERESESLILSDEFFQ